MDFVFWRLYPRKPAEETWQLRKHRCQPSPIRLPTNRFASFTLSQRFSGQATCL
jgi:hypothetical protein